jgi:hypothetical protein
MRAPGSPEEADNAAISFGISEVVIWRPSPVSSMQTQL